MRAQLSGPTRLLPSAYVTTTQYRHQPPGSGSTTRLRRVVIGPPSRAAAAKSPKHRPPANLSVTDLHRCREKDTAARALGSLRPRGRRGSKDSAGIPSAVSRLGPSCPTVLQSQCRPNLGCPAAACLQKLPWRRRAAPSERFGLLSCRWPRVERLEIFTGRSEGQKARNLGFALPPASLVLRLRAEWRGEQSNLLIF